MQRFWRATSALAAVTTSDDLALLGDQEAGELRAPAGAVLRLLGGRGLDLGCDRRRCGRMASTAIAWAPATASASSRSASARSPSRAARAAAPTRGRPPESPCCAMGRRVPRPDSRGQLTSTYRYHRAADRDARPQRADPDRRTGVRRLDDEVVADGHLDVAGVREDQITGANLGARDRNTVVDLFVGGAVQRHPGLRVGPLDQTRAVEAVGSGGAPHIGAAQPTQRGAHRDPGARVRQRRPGRDGAGGSAAPAARPAAVGPAGGPSSTWACWARSRATLRRNNSRCGDRVVGTAAASARAAASTAPVSPVRVAVVAAGVRQDGGQFGVDVAGAAPARRARSRRASR